MNINSMSQLLRRAPRRGAVSGLSRALRFCSGRTAEDILILLGTKSKIDVKEVEEQLNVAATEIRDAIAQLEQEKRVYRYTRHGKWDVLVNTPDSVVNEVLDKQSMASLMKELDALKIGIQGQKASLKDLQVVKDRCDELARKHPNIFATAGMAGMAGLWCLLFWMVFAESAFGCETFAFDWNLVWKKKNSFVTTHSRIFLKLFRSKKKLSSHLRSNRSHISWGTALSGLGSCSTTSQVWMDRGLET